MKNYPLIYGVDISKNTLDICELHTDRPENKKHFQIGNDLKSIRKFIKTRKAEASFFCMEDTGVYGLRLCSCLEEAAIEYAVVPAIHIARSKGLRRGKSDKADARDIAVYALAHRSGLSAHHLPERDLQELKLLASERDKLLKGIKLFSASEESFAYLPKSVTFGAKGQNHGTVRYLQKQLVAIEKKIEELMAQNQTMRHQRQLLESIPGIGKQTAVLLICYTRCFSSFDNWRQLACYAGLAPFEYQSGSSVRGRTKVSHFAQKKLKSVVHMAALTAKKHDPDLRLYYERKVGEGKNKMLVLNAVRCKLIARAFAVIKRDSAYINTQKYAA